MDQLKRHLDEIVNVTWNYAGRCQDDRDHLCNAVLGLTGEAGEVANLVKKMLYHKPKQGQITELVAELGDIMFYWLKVADFFGIDHDEIFKVNREKLMFRHPEKFGHEALYGVIEQRVGDEVV